MTRALVLAALLAGCPKPAPPRPVATLIDSGGLPDCPASTPQPVTAAVCGTKTTASGLRCVECQVSAPCLYRDAVVYCTPSCADPACAPGL